MKFGFARFLPLVALLVLITGCYSTPEGRLKAGVPFSKDMIVSRYEIPYSDVYEAAKHVLTDMGILNSDDSVIHVLRAKIDKNTVWVQLGDSEPGITTVSVKARTSGGGSNIALANEVDKRIYGQLIVQ